MPFALRLAWGRVVCFFTKHRKLMIIQERKYFCVRCGKRFKRELR